MSAVIAASSNLRKQARQRTNASWLAVTFLAVALLAVLPQVLLAQDSSISIPVGFVRVTVAPGESKAASLPWMPFDNDNSVQAVLKYSMIDAGSNGLANVETADQVLKFEPLAPAYVPVYRIQDNWVDQDGKDSRLTIDPGEGFLLVNKSPVSKTAFLWGQVVVFESQISLDLAPGANLIGYPYSGAGSNELAGLGLGEGAWMYSPEPRSVTFTRPYADLFTSNSGSLRITSLTPSDDGGRVMLGIRVSGGVAALDIYTQDLATNGTFRAESGWKPLALNVATKGLKEDGFWVDVLPNPAPYARVYLLACSDESEHPDQGGVPSWRERLIWGTDPTRKDTWPSTNEPPFQSSSLGTNAVSGFLLSATNGLTPARPVESDRVRVIHVSVRTGNDAFSGRTVTVSPPDGPKPSIRSGLRALRGDGDEVIIHAGRYGENLDIAGRNVKVRIEGSVDLTRNEIQPVIPQDLPGKEFRGAVTNGVSH